MSMKYARLDIIQAHKSRKRLRKMNIIALYLEIHSSRWFLLIFNLQERSTGYNHWSKEATYGCLYIISIQICTCSSKVDGFILFL